MGDGENRSDVPAWVSPPTVFFGRPGHEPDHAPARELDLQNYVRILFKYRFLIGAVTAISVFGAFLYGMLATPLYTADVSLKVGLYQPVLPGLESERNYLMQTSGPDFLNTQLEMITSLTLADHVLSDPAVERALGDLLEERPSLISSVISGIKGIFSGSGDGEGSDTTYNHPLPQLQSYIKLLRVSPVRRTSMIKLGAVTHSATLSQLIANTHAKAFIEFVRDQRQQVTMENMVFLKEQAEELAQKVSLVERNLAQYAEDNSIVALNEGENITVRRMGELNDLLTQAVAKRIKSEAAFRSSETKTNLNAAAYGDDGMNDVKKQLEEAQAEYAMLSEKFTPEYPKMQQLGSRIKTLKSQMSGERERSVASLEVLYKADLQSEEELKKQLEIQKSKTFELSRSQVQFNVMKREYESLKDLHQTVLRELKQAQVNSQNVATNVSLVDQAPVPNRPSSPRKLLTILLAGIFGPLLGIILACAAELLDNTVKTPEEVFRVLRMPALGIIPSFRPEVENPTGANQVIQLSEKQVLGDGQKNLTGSSGAQAPAVKKPVFKDNLITLNLPRSIASEAYRTIRTGILLSAAGKPPKVLLVTSAKKSEGKTTMASNLAVTLAQAGKRTVVIDADLRRPSLSRYFGGDKNVAGLVEYLTGQAGIESIVARTPVENLFMIHSGPIPPNPAELLGSQKMAELIAKLSTVCDHVVIDASPVLPVTDPAILSKMVDGVILVLRAHETKRAPAREASRRLQSVGAKVLGVVLNDVDLNSGDYYYYRDTYSYYMPDEKEGSRRKRWKGNFKPTNLS
jgi:polysaccharide biosynthesis transport protein